MYIEAILPVFFSFFFFYNANVQCLFSNTQPLHMQPRLIFYNQVYKKNLQEKEKKKNAEK